MKKSRTQPPHTPPHTPNKMGQEFSHVCGSSWSHASLYTASHRPHIRIKLLYAPSGVDSPLKNRSGQLSDVVSLNRSLVNSLLHLIPCMLYRRHVWAICRPWEGLHLLLLRISLHDLGNVRTCVVLLEQRQLWVLPHEGHQMWCQHLISVAVGCQIAVDDNRAVLF